MVAHGEIKDGDLDHGVFDSLSAFDEASQVTLSTQRLVGNQSG